MDLSAVRTGEHNCNNKRHGGECYGRVIHAQQAGCFIIPVKNPENSRIMCLKHFRDIETNVTERLQLSPDSYMPVTYAITSS
jgi:hypothetical protein